MTEQFNSLPDKAYSIVPPKLYDYTLEMIFDGAIICISDTDICKPSKYSRMDVSFTPEFIITLEEMRLYYQISHKRTFYGALAPFSLSVFQHQYNPDLKELKKERTNGFYDGRFETVVKRYSRHQTFFEKGNRGRRDVYGITNEVVAPIGENASYFNLSISDMVQIMFSGIIVKWKELPKEAVPYFELVNKRFLDYSKLFVTETKWTKEKQEQQDKEDREKITSRQMDRFHDLSITT